MKKFWNRLTEREQGFTLVELMIVVAIIGILAAIAIPQFMESVQSAKSAEAKQIMKKVAEGSKGYFSTEQKSTPASGPEPWHSGKGTAGTPVSFSKYVMPGGSSFTYNFIGNGSASIPKGGSKKQPYDPTKSDKTINAAMSWWGVELEDPLYFEYTYDSSGSGSAAAATIEAQADFDADGSKYHTFTQSVTVTDGKPNVNPAYESNTGE